MTRNGTMPTKLMEMAEKSCFAANELLKMGYLNDAASRAYYSMFYAAQALLLASDAPIKATIGKTHGGLINAFSEHIVNKGIVSKDIGKLLSIAHKNRLLADYSGDFMESDIAQKIIESTKVFFTATKIAFDIYQPDNSHKTRPKHG